MKYQTFLLAVATVLMFGSATVSLADDVESTAKGKSPRGLFQLAPDGSKLVEISPRGDLCYGSARFSHTGDQIVFDAWSTDESYSASRIFVANKDGTNLKGFNPGALPSWSPDDKQIIYRTHSTKDNSNIVVMNLDGSGEESLPINANCPRWSPNGRYIAFRSGRLGFFDASTAKVSHVNRLPGSPLWGGDWSSDGKHFCLPCVSNSSQQLAVLDIAEPLAVTSIRKLYEAHEIGCNVSWSPDGKQILFFQRDSDAALFQIYTIDVDGKSEPKLVPGQPDDRSNTDPAWSPDGKTIMFCSGTP